MAILDDQYFLSIRYEVVTYHQLGAWRTPDDWMWEAFTTLGIGTGPRAGVISTRIISRARSRGAGKWAMR
ncbi:hypothetical protein PG994_006912 [Apiospora phragmitis]|uniref:Uncharacterized protein n=1 Tax=Apiospora phragmitis TaxID=2905665 RepID=A0ABR1VJ34_9PEZI